MRQRLFSFVFLFLIATSTVFAGILTPRGDAQLPLQILDHHVNVTILDGRPPSGIRRQVGRRGPQRSGPLHAAGRRANGGAISPRLGSARGAVVCVQLTLSSKAMKWAA